MPNNTSLQDFFDGHAPQYEDNTFTHHSREEVSFIEAELSLSPGCRILDVGCGTGRHAIELARRGYLVTGIDISSGMLNQARSAAEKAGLAIEWILADAVTFKPHRVYDAAICLCEGSFGLLGVSDDPVEHDLAILRTIHTALRSGAPLLLNTLNALEKIRRVTPADVSNGSFCTQTTVETSNLEFENSTGKHSVKLRERAYTPSELQLLLRLAGFSVRDIWGGTAGKWLRQAVELSEIEIMAVAIKNNAE